MTPLVVLALLAGSPSPAFLAKFRAMKTPVTLDGNTPLGPSIPAAELEAVHPRKQPLDERHQAFALGRTERMLFVRVRYTAKRVDETTDELLTLGKDGRVLGVAELQRADNGAEEKARSSILIGRDGSLSVKARFETPIRVKDPLVHGRIADVAMERTGRITDAGEVTWERPRALNVDGDYFCADTKEYLVLLTVDGRLRAFYGAKPEEPMRELAATGSATAVTLTVDTMAVTVDPDRMAFTWTRANGTKARFERAVWIL